MQKVVDYSGKSLNQLFDTLAEWNVFLEREFSGMY